MRAGRCRNQRRRPLRADRLAAAPSPCLGSDLRRTEVTRSPCDVRRIAGARTDRRGVADRTGPRGDVDRRRGEEATAGEDPALDMRKERLGQDCRTGQLAAVTMVDRRSAAGGHWDDAYPFVRLHTPSRTTTATGRPCRRRTSRRSRSTPSARLVCVNDLPNAARPGSSYTVLGAGKTAADACVWLLGADVDPARIRWVRPRDAWFHHRSHFQPLEQVGAIMEGIALDAEAGARSADLDGLVERLEDSGRLVRLDPSAPAEMYRGTMLSTHEIQALRQIEDVVRLGRVRRIEADRIVLERGEVATGPDDLCVHRKRAPRRTRAARLPTGADRAPAGPPSHPDVRCGAGGVVEGRGGEDADKNRVCPPNPYPSAIGDWPAMVARTWTAVERCSQDPDGHAYSGVGGIGSPARMAATTARASGSRYSSP